MTLKLKQVSGGYFGELVLKDLDFELKAGELVGLIGLNGAGKSTTIQEIMGLLQPYQGEILINDHRLADDEVAYRKSIGFIPETPNLYDALTLKEHIELVALAYDLPLDEVWGRANPLLTQFRLMDKLEWLPKHFSKGMKQKVMIICAFILSADLYIIDEPFLGLDPLAIQELINLMLAKKQAGASILMSTHVLATAQTFCDRFIVLHEGRVVADGDMARLRAQFGMPDASLDDLYINLTQVPSHE